GRARPHVPRERLSDEATLEAHLPLERLLQPGVHRDPDQEPGAAGRVHLQEAVARRSPDDSRLRTDDGQPRTGALRSAERRGIGGRAALDYAVDAVQPR